MSDSGHALPVLPYGTQSIDDADIEAVVQVLRGRWLTTGPAVEAFEAALSRLGGARHAVAVSSGTAALHALYAATGLAPGDELITSPLTFVATASAAILQGGTVKFADVDATTGNIEARSAAGLVTPRTKALVAVDYAGHPAEYDVLRTLARERDLILLADGAHAFGATYRGRPVGSLADATTLSFHPVKTVTTGEGGAVLTDNDDYADRARRFRNHGIVRGPQARTRSEGVAATALATAWYYEVQSLGLNYRIPDILCALGLSQLERLDAFLARRRALAARYRQALGDLPGLEQPSVASHVSSAWHLYVVRVRERARRDAFFTRLRSMGLGVQVHYLPVYLHPVFAALGYRAGACPVAEDFAARAVSLPLYPALTDADADRVIDAVQTAHRAVL